MKKSQTLLEDHHLHNEGIPLENKKRKSGIQKLLSPILAACLLTCGVTQAETIDKETQAKQLRAEARALLSGSSANETRKPIQYSEALMQSVQEKLAQAEKLDPPENSKEKKSAELDLIGGKDKPGRLIPQGGNPKKGITITVHGINDNPSSVEPLGNKAKKTGEAITTFAWDDKSRRLSDSSDDFAICLHDLLQTHPNSPITINAHSMGGRMAAVALGRLEKTGSLDGKNIALNLVAPPLKGFPAADHSWIGVGIAPDLKSSIDMGSNSKFQKELENLQLKNTQVEIYTGAEDEIATPDPEWENLAKKLAGGKPPTIVPNTNHDNAPENIGLLLAETPQKSGKSQQVQLPKAWEDQLKTLHKKCGTTPSRADLVQFHRETQIASEIQDATNFLQKHRNIPHKSADAEVLRLQTTIEVEGIWKNAHHNIPPEREKEIRLALKTLQENKPLQLVGSQTPNQLVDTHRERLAVARDLQPGYDPFNGKQEIEESLKSKTQTTTSPTNEGKPTKNIIIVGEKHHDEKNQALYPALLDNLHKKGFRTLSLEFPENHNKKPLETLLKTLEKENSTIQKDTLLNNHVRSHGLSKEWIETYAKAKQLGWDIHLTDKPTQDIAQDIHSLENTKEKLSEGQALTTLDAKKLEEGKTNLAGLPKKTWEEINKTENAQIESRSQHIAENLAKLPGKVLHIGGSLHTSEIQDAYANITGKRPLGLQIDYTPSQNPLQKLVNPTPEDKMEKHLDINKRTARHSKNCFEIPCNPEKALQKIDSLTPKEPTKETPQKNAYKGPEM